MSEQLASLSPNPFILSADGQLDKNLTINQPLATDAIEFSALLKQGEAELSRTESGVLPVPVPFPESVPSVKSGNVIPSGMQTFSATLNINDKVISTGTQTFPAMLHNNGNVVSTGKQTSSATLNSNDIKGAPDNLGPHKQVRSAVHSIVQIESSGNNSQDFKSMNLQSTLGTASLPKESAVDPTETTPALNAEVKDATGLKQVPLADQTDSMVVRVDTDHSSDDLPKTINGEPEANVNNLHQKVDIERIAHALKPEVDMAAKDNTEVVTDVRKIPELPAGPQNEMLVDPLREEASVANKISQSGINPVDIKNNSTTNNLENHLRSVDRAAQPKLSAIENGVVRKEILAENVTENIEDEVSNDILHKATQIYAKEIKPEVDVTQKQLKQYQLFNSPERILEPIIADYGPVVQANVLPANINSQISTASAPVFQIDKPINNPAWNDEFGEQIKWISKQQLQSAEIRLNPAHLGSIEVKIQMQNEQATIQFTAMNASVKEALELAMPRLREMMEANGIQLADVDIEEQSQSDHRHLENGDSRQGRDATDHVEATTADNVVTEDVSITPLVTNSGLDLFV